MHRRPPLVQFTGSVLSRPVLGEADLIEPDGDVAHNSEYSTSRKRYAMGRKVRTHDAGRVSRAARQPFSTKWGGMDEPILLATFRQFLSQLLVELEQSGS